MRPVDHAPVVRRVLLATAGLDYGGGIASVSRCMLRALEEEAEQDRLERVDVLSLADDFDGPGRFGARRSARGSQGLFVLHAWRMMRRRPDLVLLDHLGLGRAFQLPLPGIRPRRSAVFIHGTEFWAVDGGPRAEVVRAATHILTNSEFTADTVRERMPDVGDRVSPVLLCIDPDLVDAWGSAGRVEASSDRERAVLMVGRMEEGEPGKGHEALLEAWNAVKQAVPDARLWIAGGGSGRPALETLARRVAPHGVEFLGKVSNEELSRLYDRASLLAMPSRQEGFGLVYAEAMWHGLPCIASTADAGREVVRDGVTGALVPYGDPPALADAIIALLRDPDRVRALATNARAEARARFGYERFRADFLAALHLGPSN